MILFTYMIIYDNTFRPPDPMYSESDFPPDGRPLNCGTWVELAAVVLDFGVAKEKKSAHLLIPRNKLIIIMLHFSLVTHNISMFAAVF